MSGTVSSSSAVLPSDADQKRLVAGNATHQDYPLDVLVPQLVAAQAAATPNAVAVAANHEVLTYAELEARSNQIAHCLRSFGVGPEALVGLCLDRSCVMVIAALGVLKSGGAYLPLDPAYPAERLTFMLNDAQAPVLLTKQHFAARLPAGKWRVINLDLDEPQIPRSPAESSSRSVEGKNLAYVIYTSGSTGKPKGVQITHDSLLNLVFWHQQAFGVTRSDRATQLASPGFDAAVWELWPYLTAGASVFLPVDAIRNDAESLRNWLVAERITITFVPTPLAERMLALEWPRQAALRIFLTGADTLHTYPPPNLPFTLINNYGPTECTVVASSGPVLSDERPDSLPSIGRPVANTEIYVLDEQMRQVSVGTAGGIYIGGAGLARGYLNRPELTAERFVPNPFSSDGTARLYKTGDLARYLPDGQLAFVGRIDEQVKIRGYRVEPNEITTVLNRHPMIQESLVLAREATPGDKRLVAYVVPKSGTQPTDKDLRYFLNSKLPDFMVPAIFVRMDSMPLNASGKVDRGVLRAPTEANILRDENYVCARTPLEQGVTNVLAGLLHLKKVGVNDNFFLLGGNSLLGAQVIAQVRDTFGVELSLLSLFDHPTASQLSAEIERLLLAKVGAMSEDDAERLSLSFRKDTNV